MDRSFFCQQCFKKLEIHPSFAKVDDHDIEKIFGRVVSQTQSSSAHVSPQTLSPTSPSPLSSTFVEYSKTLSTSKVQTSVTSPKSLSSSHVMVDGFVLVGVTAEKLSKSGRGIKRVVVTPNKKSPPTNTQNNRLQEQQQLVNNDSNSSELPLSVYDTVGKLFDLTTSELELDMPLCAECAHTILGELNKSLEESQKDMECYQKFLRQLEAEEFKRNDETLFENEIEIAKKEEKELKKELDKVLRERERLHKIMNRLKDEEEKKLKFEQKYWREYGILRLEQENFLEERRSVRQKLKYSLRRLESIRQQHVLNECFHIWYEGPFGTINGLRLGRLPSVPVEWTEINAAWGFTVHLTYELSRRLQWECPKYKLIPMGSQSRLEATNNDTDYELFGDHDASFFRVFAYRRLDNGMAAFLEYLHSLAEHISLSHDNTFRLPHKYIHSLLRCSVGF